MDNLLDYAIAYAKKNIFVFPCRLDKKPITAHGFQDATTDLEQVRAWWTAQPQASIGVACGASGWVVLDIDADKGGYQSFDVLFEQGIVEPDDLYTMTNLTGGGGMHIIWKAPEGVNLSNSAGKLGKGLDIRANGGYIIAPPSGHPSGNRYAFKLLCSVKPCPPKLVTLLTTVTPPTPPTSLAAPAPQHADRILQRAYERIANANEGMRNETINKAAWYLFGLVAEGKLNESEARTVIEMGAQRCGYPQRETLAVIRSVAAKRWAGLGG